MKMKEFGPLRRGTHSWRPFGAANKSWFQGFTDGGGAIICPVFHK